MIAKSEKMDALAENIVEQQAIKGRSLWQDAWRALFGTKRRWLACLC